MTTTSQRRRDWRGPALFAAGFRPFFLGAALWAALAMALWIGMLAGAVTIPTAFDPVSWHAHAFLFGYLGAVIAGFMTTAVPNWTGRMPIVGWPLAALFALWVVGRLAVATSARIGAGPAAAADLAFPVTFALLIAREIVAGRNWRNLTVLAILVVFILANALFHLEAAHGAYAAEGHGLRLGLAAALMLVALIGGRIVPSFTRNWLVKRGDRRLPTPPMQPFDRLAMAVLLLALITWVIVPMGWFTGATMGAAGVLHLVRLARWRGHLTFAEPLVAVLHAGYAFLPLGALAMSVEAVAPGTFVTAGQHLWMAGGIGLMTVAVMTRATLGHNGEALTAGWATIAIYGALGLAVVVRVAAGALSAEAGPLYEIAGANWIAAFAGFALVYGKLLLRASPTKRGRS